MLTIDMAKKTELLEAIPKLLPDHKAVFAILVKPIPGAETIQDLNVQIIGTLDEDFRDELLQWVLDAHKRTVEPH